MYEGWFRDGFIDRYTAVQACPNGEKMSVLSAPEISTFPQLYMEEWDKKCPGLKGGHGTLCRSLGRRIQLPQRIELVRIGGCPGNPFSKLAVRRVLSPLPDRCRNKFMNEPALLPISGWLFNYLAALLFLRCRQSFNEALFCWGRKINVKGRPPTIF